MGIYLTKLNDYDGFVEKFKPKKTTDDCYTPKEVYDEVLKFVGELTGLTGREIVRPFWPGGDYESYDYPDNCIVVDNPPFSQYSKMVRFYLAHGIDFFLFAPALTQFVPGASVCHIVCSAEVTYENGAVVLTSFTTNLVPDVRVWVCGPLTKRLQNLRPAGPGRHQQTVYPANVITSATMGKIAARGVDFKVYADQCCSICRTDKMPKGKQLFGSGFLLSERAAAERAAAERAAAERAAAERAAAERATAERATTERAAADIENAFVIELSEREHAVIDLLNKQEKAR